MTKNKQAIGIFDSGIGGTSIWKEVSELLPHENTIYLADSKNAPYGQKSKKEIISFCKKNIDFLLDRKCKLIIVACNTATTNAIKLIRKEYNIPFIGIEPAIKPAALKTKTNTIGILATKGTLSSALFSKTAKKFGSEIEIIEQVGEGLVALIENGKIESKEIYSLLESYLQPMLLKKIDYLVLGCTHYPYLIPKIKKIVGENVIIIDSGLAVAKQTKVVLEKFKLRNSSLKKGEHTFYSNSNSTILKQLINDFKNTTIHELEF